MKQTPNTGDKFFYFFAGYSSLLIVLDYIGGVIFLLVITYIALLIYFCYKLNGYFSYILENKKIAEKKKKSKSEKELTMKYEEVKETFKEGVIILGLTVCFFIAVGNTDRYLENTSQDFVENTSAIKSNISEVGLANINEPEMVGAPNPEIINDDYADINIPVEIDDTEKIEPVLEILDSKIDEVEINREVSSIDSEIVEVVENITAIDTGTQSSDDELTLDKNFPVQVKDVYALEPFTKEGSGFFNTMQLQKVLQRLGYFTGIPDGTFTFETKMAIYNALVTECGWPAESTTGVFGNQAKACFDNLYISPDQSQDGLFKESF